MVLLTRTKTTESSPHSSSRSRGRHARTKDVSQVIPDRDLRSVTLEQQRVSKRNRLGAILGVAALGVLAAAPAHHLLAERSSPAPAAVVADNIHSLAQKAMAAYDTAAREHTGFGYTADGGREAIVKIDTATGPIKVVVVSSKTTMGPNKTLKPDWRNATSITASEMLPGGPTTATEVANNGISTVINTAPTQSNASQEIVETILGDDGPVTSFQQRSMGAPSPAKLDRTLSTAEQNFGAANLLINDVTQQLDILAGQTSVSQSPQSLT
jgi:hypothetical protein